MRRYFATASGANTATIAAIHSTPCQTSPSSGAPTNSPRRALTQIVIGLISAKH